MKIEYDAKWKHLNIRQERSFDYIENVEEEQGKEFLSPAYPSLRPRSPCLQTPQPPASAWLEPVPAEAAEEKTARPLPHPPEIRFLLHPAHVFFSNFRPFRSLPGLLPALYLIPLRLSSLRPNRIRGAPVFQNPYSGKSRLP